ncbi:MAG: hypothetical protein PHO12_08970 [Bacteroidales bacterium]|nr:hypothetical protein [Bacteroidales bacterium]MDD4685160.1 hypothetical protein [Bacteroidales bacterium]
MITEEIKEQVKEMYYNGRTKTDISRTLKISIYLIGNILQHNKKITDRQKKEMKELYKQGLNKAEIARKLEVSWGSVHRIIENKQYTYKRIPKKTSEEIRREREERNRRLKDSIKEEDVVYPTELDECLAEIRKSKNDIHYKGYLKLIK